MKIKICGIRRKKDLLTCENTRADLIGFINIERSKRLIKTGKIKDLISSMKDQNKAVLVIEPENMADAQERIEKTGLMKVQLHSLLTEDIIKLKKHYQTKNEPNKCIDPVKTYKSDLTVIRALGLPEKINSQKIREIQDFARVCDGLLFDSEIEGKTGGTGRQIPLETATEAAKIAKNCNHDLKLFLAGGMNKKRIENELKTLDNFFDFVDVNSGVEDEPGVKNTAKINDLMKIKVI
jgi:phosphoribosylanthranilate isomerase